MTKNPPSRLPIAMLLFTASAPAHARLAQAPAPAEPPTAPSGGAPVAPGEAPGAAPPPADPPLEDPEPAPPPEAATRPGSAEAPRRALPPGVDEHGPARTLRLPAAIKLALRQHPQLLAARAETRALEAQVGIAQSRYFPRVNGSLQYVRASENGSLSSFYSVPGLARVGGSQREGVEWHHSFNNFLVAVIAQQALYDFGRTQGRVGAARALVKIAEMNEQLIEQRVIFDVIRAFYAVRNARESVRIAEEALVNAEGIYELAAAGTKTGLRPASEQARAEADVAAAQVALIRARLDFDVARARAANAVGAPAERLEPADEELPSPSSIPTVDDSIAVALANRPELRALDLRREAMAQTLRSVRARQLPRIDALLGVSSRGQFLPAADQEPYQRFNWSAGVVVDIPMFQGLAVRKEKQGLQAEMSALDSRQEAIRQAVILEVKEAVAMVRAADEAERASYKGVQAAKVALEVSQGRYRAGLGPLIELTDAQATYVAARSQAVQGRYERHIARAALDLAMGVTAAPREASQPSTTPSQPPAPR